MKQTPEERAKATSAAIAHVRHFIVDFTIKELAEALKNNHCPYAAQVPTLLIEKGLITKFGDTYHFPNPEPIHFRLLESGMTKIAKSACDYSKKSYNSKFKPNEVATVSVITASEIAPSTELSDETLVSLLKARGFKVYKPVIGYEEC